MPREIPSADLEGAFQTALALLSNRKCRVGIYAGLGCMDFSADLVRAAELMQAPVATSVSGNTASTSDPDVFGVLTLCP